MGEPDSDVVVVGADGSMRVGGADAARRLRERTGRYRLVADTPAFLILRRDSGDATQHVLMAGEIVSRMTVMEIINLIASSNWRGDLHVVDDDSHRVLTFDQGALKHAWSSHPDDRLGEVLYRTGVISRGQLEGLLQNLSADRRFGQLCVDEGIVDQETLFHYLGKQGEQIFNNALLVAEGQYAFVIGDESELPDSATLHLPIQGLLMEGLQRVDEMALFRERIPSDQMCPEVKPGAGDKPLDPMALTLLAYCDGTRSIEEIARSTGLGEFETTKAIHQLLQQGVVVLRAATQIDDDALLRIVNHFNDVMRDIFMAVATYGGVDQTRQTLAAWIQGSGYAPYFGDMVEEDGSIPAPRVLRALTASPTERPLEAIHQALHELAAFALFAATTTLPRDQELALSRDVNRRLKAMRIE